MVGQLFFICLFKAELEKIDGECKTFSSCDSLMENGRVVMGKKTNSHPLFKQMSLSNEVAFKGTSFVSFLFFFFF